MYEINVGGTRNILEAALKQGLSRVVYTSSVGTLGNPGNGTARGRKNPGHPCRHGRPLQKKQVSRRTRSGELPQAGLPLVIVNPSTPVGALDIKPTPTGRIIVDFLNRKMPAYLDTGLNIIDVEDCARGHILAARKGGSVRNTFSATKT